MAKSKNIDVTVRGRQYCNRCKEETWHTPKLGLVVSNRRLCEICSTSNVIPWEYTPPSYKRT